MLTYFITSAVWRKKQLFQNPKFALLCVNCLVRYREQKRFLLHEFVVMPDHVHILISPVSITIERAVQFIKGGVSYELKKLHGYRGEVWQVGYYDRRVRNAEEYAAISGYILQNPVKRALCKTAIEFPFSSARRDWQLDPLPQWLKPPSAAPETRA